MVSGGSIHIYVCNHGDMTTGRMLSRKCIENDVLTYDISHGRMMAINSNYFTWYYWLCFRH